MSAFWIIYFVSLGFVILFTVLTNLLFTYDGGKVFKLSQVIIMDFTAAIPAVGIIEAFFLLVTIGIGMLSDDLECKFE